MIVSSKLQHLSKAIPAIEVERKFTVIPENWVNLKNKFTKLAINQPKIIKLDDIYYDSEYFKLVKKDNWLRNRNNNWEIKIPYPGKQISGSKSTVYQYNVNYINEYDLFREIEDEKNVLEYISENKSKDYDYKIENYLCANNIMPFAHVSSTRTTFICERIHIDVDDIEFLDWRDSSKVLGNHMVGEVEIMAKEEKDIDECQDYISQFLKENGLEDNNKFNSSGKLNQYLRRYRSDVFEELVKSNVFHLE